MGRARNDQRRRRTAGTCAKQPESQENCWDVRDTTRDVGELLGRARNDQRRGRTAGTCAKRPETRARGGGGAGGASAPHTLF